MKKGMILVHSETLTLTNDDEEFEQLANVINFFVSLVAYFSNKMYIFCHKVTFFNKLLMAKNEGILTVVSRLDIVTLMHVKFK